MSLLSISGYFARDYVNTCNLFRFFSSSGFVPLFVYKEPDSFRVQ